MTKTTKWIRVLPCAALLALAGCEDGTNPFQSALSGESTGGTEDTIVANADGAAVIERDVESPDVFAANETGLWDGRPSLGGVWVAHPDVTEPERVVIRNPTTGSEVIGALFRRERENPGPRIQVSSEAADALNMLAGQPAELAVVVLRREREEIVPETPAEPAPVAIAQAPVEEAPAPTPEPTPEPEAPVVTAAATPAPAPAEPTIRPAAPAPVTASTLPEVPTRRPVTDAATVAADALAAVSSNASRIETATTNVATSAPAGVTTASVAQTAPQARTPRTTASAIAAALTGKRNPAPRAAAAATSVTPVSAPARAPVSRLEKPFIQVGIFNDEANAKNVANSLRQSGVVPNLLAQDSNGRAFWRVTVGPAQTSATRRSLLDKIQALGYSDAYFVTN